MVAVWKALLIGLLLLAACSNGAPAINDITGDVIEDLAAVCPDCPACPAAQVCPACPAAPACPALDAATGLLELRLSDVALLREDRGEQPVNYRFSADEYDALAAATLRFEARCSDAPPRVRVEVRGEAVYDANPVCLGVTSVELPLSLLDDGRNTILFYSDADERFRLDDIVLSARFQDGTSADQDLYVVEFDPAQNDEVEFEDFSDARIMNYEEYEFELDEGDLDEAYVFTFQGEERDGELLVLVNDQQVFSGEVSRRENRVEIPADLLEEGTNYVTLIGR